MKRQVGADGYSYFQRDISWLSFNYRILQEAKDPMLPLFERLKFLAIYASNLEEFYRIRVSEYRKKLLDKTSDDPEYQHAFAVIDAIQAEVYTQAQEYAAFFEQDILEQMAHFQLVVFNSPTQAQTHPIHRQYIEDYFKEEVFPYIEPRLITQGEVQSFMRDHRLYLVVETLGKADTHFAHQSLHFLIKVPFSKVPRFIELPSFDGCRYVMFLEDLIKANLAFVFPGFHVQGAYMMSVSRDADFLLSPEASGQMVEELKRHIRKRKLGAANRLVYEETMPRALLNLVCTSFHFHVNRCIAQSGHQHLEDLVKIPFPTGGNWKEVTPQAISITRLDQAPSIAKAIEQQDYLLHFPYHRFDYLLRLLSEVAFDPTVSEIKVTQYRVATNSEVVKNLITAVRQGKKVTVFVELKARFDEENNLAVAELMHEAGIEVVYSSSGLKVHAKMLLIYRYQDQKKSVPWVLCGSTGNFNEKTASIYSDVVLLTARPSLLEEVDRLFAALQQKVKPQGFQHLLVAQDRMFETLIELIDQEISLAQRGEPAQMILKMNALQDEGMIRKLYQASEAGVRIELIVRGICCLIPNQSYSKHIRITRIVDTYLEHARIFYFLAGGKELIYISSADWMKRSLTRRIEVAYPIYDDAIKSLIKRMLELQLRDNVKACWINENLENTFKALPEGQLQLPVRWQREWYHQLKD